MDSELPRLRGLEEPPPETAAGRDLVEPEPEAPLQRLAAHWAHAAFPQPRVHAPALQNRIFQNNSLIFRICFGELQYLRTSLHRTFAPLQTKRANE